MIDRQQFKIQVVSSFTEIDKDAWDCLIGAGDLQTKDQLPNPFITHAFLEAIKMGDAIAIMKDGDIVQIGTPEAIVANRST